MTLFVIGKPIKHSLSPIIHNFWIKKYKINLEYKKMEVDKDSLPSLVEKVRKGDITGLNVTLPYKKDIIMHIDKYIFVRQRGGLRPPPPLLAPLSYNVLINMHEYIYVL